MSLATLDTHEVVVDLRSAGFTDEQAAAVARNLRKAQDLDLSALATKSDLQSETEKLRADIEKLRAEGEKGRAENHAESDKLRAEIGKDIAETKAEILKYMIGTISFQTLIILGAVVTLIKLIKP